MVLHHFLSDMILQVRQSMSTMWLCSWQCGDYTLSNSHSKKEKIKRIQGDFAVPYFLNDVSWGNHQFDGHILDGHQSIFQWGLDSHDVSIPMVGYNFRRRSHMVVSSSIYFLGVCEFYLVIGLRLCLSNKNRWIVAIKVVVWLAGFFIEKTLHLKTCHLGFDIQ